MEMIMALITLAALPISLLALVRTRKFNAKLLAFEEEHAKYSRLQTQRLEREEKERTKCEVIAYWYTGENDSDRVAIGNSGAVLAYDIRFEFKPKKGCTSPDIMEERFPIERLGPGEKEYFLIRCSISTGRTWPATIYWRNEADEEFEADIVLGEQKKL